MLCWVCPSSSDAEHARQNDARKTCGRALVLSSCTLRSGTRHPARAACRCSPMSRSRRACALELRQQSQDETRRLGAVGVGAHADRGSNEAEHRILDVEGANDGACVQATSAVGAQRAPATARGGGAHPHAVRRGPRRCGRPQPSPPGRTAHRPRPCRPRRRRRPLRPLRRRAAPLPAPHRIRRPPGRAGGTQAARQGVRMRRMPMAQPPAPAHLQRSARWQRASCEPPEAARTSVQPIARVRGEGGRRCRVRP
jgi:hypothetical protein